MTSRTPATPVEIQAIDALKGVSFPVASWDKRFFRSIASLDMLTDKERPQLWRLLIRYRRQWTAPNKAALLKHAESLAAPDFRKQQAALAAQAKIDAEKARYAEAMTGRVGHSMSDPHYKEAKLFTCVTPDKGSIGSDVQKPATPHNG